MKYIYFWEYKTPSEYDDIILYSDEKYLRGLFFTCFDRIEKYKIQASEFKKIPVLESVCSWLDIYFQGERPDFTPAYCIDEITDFRKEVLGIVEKIPYGETISYGDIARQIAKSKNINRMSAQAVGGAVGWNPISIIVPCHRVVGSNGELTGYGGGLKNKKALLKLEKIL